jgi:long-subunit fatty acid transport protein
MTFAEKLTVSLKYEMLTKIELTNETTVDGTGAFPDGGKSRADMPAMFSLGAAYPVTKKLNATVSYNYFFDKNADYGKKDATGKPVTNESVIDKNFFELGLGLEYNITDKFLVSAGYLLAKTGVSEAYQNDLSFSNTSNSVAGGIQYKISPAIALNLGGIYVMYKDGNKSFTHMLGTNSIPVNEIYGKTTWMAAVGLDISIGKK